MGTDGPMNSWFGLSYSNYLVLPRAILQSMPEDWQARLVALLDEARAATDAAGVTVPDRYRVHVVDMRGRFVLDSVPHYRHVGNIFEPKRDL